MRTLLFMTTLSLVLAGVATASGCEPSTTHSGVVAVGTYYVYEPCLDEDGPEQCQWWGPWSIWVYEESNGIAGLQRQDEMVDDTCGGRIAGDTVVF